MFKRKRKKNHGGATFNSGPNMGTMPANTPIEDTFQAFIDYEKKLGVLDESTIRAHETRLLGKNNSGPVLSACHKSGLRCVGDIPNVPFRLIKKNIQKIATTRAQVNNLCSSFKKSSEYNVEVGNITLPAGSLRAVRQEKNRPCSPKQLSDEQIDYFRQSKKGRTPSLAARNDLIGEFELLYAIRPGKEITNIDDAKVHPLEGFMDILRDDGLMQRIYLRRDTCDHIIAYRRLRAEILKVAGETGAVTPFFIKERNV
jgi:hypothetical protein